MITVKSGARPPGGRGVIFGSAGGSGLCWDQESLRGGDLG